MPAWVFFGLGEFEGIQNRIARCNSVRKALQSWREPFKFVPAEVTVARAGCKDQIVVVHSNVLPVRVGYEDTFPVFIHACHLSQDHRRVHLLSENRANWKADL